ncbi:MAG: ornithine cyclodeaminase family protein [Fidelibacterota bacterium]|jgi:ornithine cyclodeaminase/alanine dehydrogenase-like protein (mu-crystallin family)
MNLPFYGKKDLSAVIQMTDAIEAMKDAFIALSNGTAVVPHRINLQLEDKDALNLSMPAYIKGGLYNTIKVVNVHFNNPKKGLPLINGLILVMDSEKGSPLAIIDGKSVTSLRTGAASGLATDLLSNKDSKCAFIFGTGVQAKSQLEAICCVRDFSSIFIVGNSEEKTKNFCSEYNDIVQPGTVDNLKEADVICTATTSEEPLFNIENIRPGVHINAVGAHRPNTRELDTSVIQASKIYIDELSSSKIEAGDIIIPVNEGKYTWDKIEGELGDLIDEKLTGRTNPSEITLFNSIGNAVQDLIIASIVVEKKLKLKL